MKIVGKSILTDIAEIKITRVRVLAPLIAEKALPGQFVVVMVSESGERIPLTVVDTNPDKGEITLIFQESGMTTKLFGKLDVGDSLYALAGPLGHPTPIKKYGKVVVVGGGVGIAEIYPVTKALKGAGNHIITIVGARTKDALILESELREVSEQVYVCTDDGSYGKKSFTTEILEELLAGSLKHQAPNLVYAVGPIPMMRKAASVTKPHAIKTIVSLNALMVDATGMCGSCRVTVDNKTQFSCIDGPEFDAHLIDWDELEKRNRIYADKEKHICNLYNLL